MLELKIDEKKNKIFAPSTGIGSAGAIDPNQLPELLKTYTKHQIANNLWKTK